MRLPADTASRTASTAPAMSPRRNGSCAGASPARNARAASGSARPRRTSTDAVTFEMPSAAASARASRCSQGPIVQSPDTRPSYGGGRTEAVSAASWPALRPKMYRFRFTLVYVSLALLLAGSAYGGYRGLQTRAPASRHAEAASCSAPRVGHDPVMTAVTFIHAAVERTNPKAGFALATPALRGATTCDDWARGNVPVK